MCIRDRDYTERADLQLNTQSRKGVSVVKESLSPFLNAKADVYKRQLLL